MTRSPSELEAESYTYRSIRPAQPVTAACHVDDRQTAFSSQFETIRHRLYATTRAMLDELDLVEPFPDTRRVEITQAWILMVSYELMKTNYHRAWPSVGGVSWHV